MSEKPKFGGMYKDRTFTELFPGFFPVVQITSNGKNFNIDLAEWCIEHFTVEVIETMKFILEDACYRVRPDLRRQ